MQTNELVDAPARWGDLWGLVSESLLAGVHHALNNRVAALSAIAQVFRAGMANSGPLVASLASEVDQLEETVSMLSSLRRARAPRPEPVQVPQLVEALTPVLGQHNDLRETVFLTSETPDLLPLLAERDLLTRVLLTLLVAAGIDAEWVGCRRVGVSYRGDEEAVTIRIACERNGEALEADELRGRRIDASAAREAAREMGGKLEVERLERGDNVYELRLPTLLAARRGSIEA